MEKCMVTQRLRTFRHHEALSSLESGFSLLEVLIALLVLSVGLLGIAGLQTFSLQFNHQSYERTQATVLISEMFEKIAANPTAARAGISTASTHQEASPMGRAPQVARLHSLPTSISPAGKWRLRTQGNWPRDKEELHVFQIQSLAPADLSTKSPSTGWKTTDCS